MAHIDVFETFKAYFPNYADNIADWFLNGKNCIRIRLKDGRQFIFTYNNSKDWKLEAAERYLKNLKSGR